MSQVLIEKIRRARETSVPAGGHHFTVRRPTSLEMAEIDGAVTQREILRRFVTGWDVIESDLFPGGTGESVTFSPDLFIEWVADKPGLWAPLINAINDSYREFKNKVEDDLKKSSAG